MNRIQHLNRGVIAFGYRCSPVSYGILCDKAYKAHIHLGEPVRYDARDKKTYAIDQIDWIVIQVQNSLIMIPWKVGNGSHGLER